MDINNYTSEDLIKIIKLRKKVEIDNNYKALFDEAIEMLSSFVGVVQKQKNRDFDEAYADFITCSHTNEADHLLTEKSPAETQLQQ